MAAKVESMEVKTAAVQLSFSQYLPRAPMLNSREISTEKGYLSDNKYVFIFYCYY